MNGGLSLQTRLMLAFFAVAIGVLALSGAATYALVSRSIEKAALDDMRERSEPLATSSEDFRVRIDDPTTPNRNELEQSTQRVRQTMNLTDLSFVVLGPDGRFVDPRQPLLAQLFRLPDGLVLEDIDPQRLLAGEEVSGRRGDLVFLAQAVGDDRLGKVVIVATDEIDNEVLRRAVPLMFVASGLVLLLVGLLSVWLARRLTRPIGAIETAARGIANGDLSARAHVPRGTDEELAALAGTLNTMAAQLEQARGSERAFLLSVSHDLRTPLTSIRGYADALSDGTIDVDDPAARNRAAEVISSEARRLERLVRDLLDLSRLDTRQFSLKPIPSDVTAVVRNSAEAFTPAARDLDIDLAVIADQPIAGDIDPERLGQIVANLVENAMKYARSSVAVSTGAEADGRFAIVVTDDGPGIPAEELPRVFERLYTVRNSPGRSVGTGLGLAIVHELAVRMGGTARVEASANGGARFVVSLPASGSA